MIPLVLAAGVAAAIAAPLLTLVIRWSDRLDLVDHPNARSSHVSPTPRGGGIAILAGTLIGTVIYVGLVGGGEPSRRVVGFALGVTVVFGVSLLDDLRPMPPVVRLLIHALAAALLLTGPALSGSLVMPVVGPVPLPGPAIIWYGLWVVGLTNVYNFMDGIDGIAGGQGIIAGLLWSGLGYLAGSAWVTGIAVSLTASCLVFLVRNWSPASVFMGDAGSAVIGFTLAALPLLLAEQEPDRFPLGLAVGAGALAVWPFLFDAVVTILRRIWGRENILRAHRSHLYQRLVLAGVSHQRVSIGYILLAAAGVVAAWAWLTGRDAAGWGALLLPVILGSSLWWVVRRREFVAGLNRAGS